MALKKGGLHAEAGQGFHVDKENSDKKGGKPVGKEGVGVRSVSHRRPSTRQEGPSRQTVGPGTGREEEVTIKSCG